MSSPKRSLRPLATAFTSVFQDLPVADFKVQSSYPREVRP